MPMTNQVALILGASLSVVTAALGFSPADTGHPLATFESATQGFIVQYPNDWRTLILSDVFYIEDFPSSEAVNAVRLPPNGAGIKVLSPSQVLQDAQAAPKSLEEWARVGSGRRTRLKEERLELAEGDRKLRVIEVLTQCCKVRPYQESVEWYFEVGGHKFVGILFYWQGAPNTEQLRETLKQVVLSLRVIPMR